jgi:hypothetical protein
MITYAIIDDVKETSNGGSTIDIYWEDNDKGFGHIYLYYHHNKELQIDTEYMGKEFTKKVFNKLINSAEIKE